MHPMATRKITVHDLRNVRKKNGIHNPHPTLFCVECESRFSADPSDYWILPNEHVFECCDRPMRLVIFREVADEVSVGAGISAVYGRLTHRNAKEPES